jgi:hypothetical protein
MKYGSSADSHEVAMSGKKNIVNHFLANPSVKWQKNIVNHFLAN